ncbi:cytochrome P450 [Serendipita vermifera]|nr:cytochrome P450 [Serendipita vermifera]
MVFFQGSTVHYGEYLSLRYVTIGFGAIMGITILQGLWNTPSSKARRAGTKLPPGPKQDILIGNLRNFPKIRWYETFTRRRKEFGDIIYVDLMGTPMLILNSLNAVEDLIEKRGSIYSGRPYTVMANRLMYHGWFMVLAQPGHRHEQQRRILKKSIGTQRVPEYDNIIETEAAALLEALSGFRGDPHSALTASVGTVIFKISYGEKIYREHGDELIRVNKRRIELATWAYPRVWLVNFLPFLQFIPAWFPGATFRRVGQEATRVCSKVRFLGFELVERDFVNGIADESLVSKHMNDLEVPKDILRDAVGVLYAAGSDTTSTSITNFLYTLVLYPDVQKRIQEELDERIGDGRRPTMKDVGKLVYFKAAWNESMRFNVTTPLGVPHVNTEPDVYEGYYIPKGCMIHCNIGCILRDPKIWGNDADSYNPERFLPEINPRATDLPDMSMVPFGFGKRICPGRHVAERVALVFAASVLSAFTLVPVGGTGGEFRDAVTRRPIDFQCAFIPRR